MSTTAARVLIFGIPLLLSLSWFLYWVLRLRAAARRLKAGRGTEGKAP
ncbi:MAG TPA: hypothetical protein VFI08_03745 [Spirochaetia bacterium]|nr:hypothetical protein [Spirochaetia bacterium]